VAKTQTARIGNSLSGRQGQRQRDGVNGTATCNPNDLKPRPVTQLRPAASTNSGCRLESPRNEKCRAIFGTHGRKNLLSRCATRCPVNTSGRCLSNASEESASDLLATSLDLASCGEYRNQPTSCPNMGQTTQFNGNVLSDSVGVSLHLIRQVDDANVYGTLKNEKTQRRKSEGGPPTLLSNTEIGVTCLSSLHAHLANCEHKPCGKWPFQRFRHRRHPRSAESRDAGADHSKRQTEFRIV
jgi:hypothetical protein